MTTVAPRRDRFVHELSPARRRLIQLLQTLNFGRVEDLVVRGGEPVLDPPPQVVREVKFGSDNGPRVEAKLADFALKDQHQDLFGLLDDLQNGCLPVLTVKHGLPFHAEVRN